MNRAFAFLMLGMLMALLGPSNQAWSCMAVGHRGQVVNISEESAVIIWDAKTQTQHFIRRAKFVTAAKDFGFLVPTPTRPELAEAPESLFYKLHDMTVPPPPPPVFLDGRVGAKVGSPASKSVVVLEKKTVAGFDASVLKANDAQLLADWLKAHEYPSGEEMASWLTPYVAHGWIITAFKVSQDSPGANSSAVRMSFKAEKPFFPYREPPRKEGGAGNRLLRVYFLGEQKYRGTFAEQPWNATVPHAAPVYPIDRKTVLDYLKLPKAPEMDSWFLTEFEDRVTHRPSGSEVYFEPDPQGKEVRRPVPSAGWSWDDDDNWSVSGGGNLFRNIFGNIFGKIEPEILQFILIVASLVVLTGGLAWFRWRKKNTTP
ncbi:MAG: DUF2330 domain-containing protein [Gemmataceae bacterium]|nr:DUF2330 domain-containing protein [Gemmataceae bacterium]